MMAVLSRPVVNSGSGRTQFAAQAFSDYTIFDPVKPVGLQPIIIRFNETCNLVRATQL